MLSLSKKHFDNGGEFPAAMALGFLCLASFLRLVEGGYVSKT